MKAILSLTAGFCLFAVTLVAQNERSVNNVNNGMPNRISMNVTVPKQTQGATFGEKVNAGLSTNGAFVIFPKHCWCVKD